MYRMNVGIRLFTAAAAAKSLQSCPTLCNRIDNSNIVQIR